jgi:hypothetical protein
MNEQEPNAKIYTRRTQGFSERPDAADFTTDPPPSLTPEQAKFWREAVARMPPNWFLPEALPVLEAYCVQVTRQREISAQLNAWEGKKFTSQHFKLLREENMGARQLMALSTAP